MLRPEPSLNLSLQALAVWRLHACLKGLLLALIPIGYGVIIYFYSTPKWILWILILAFFVYLTIVVLIIPPIRWRKWCYNVYDHEIDLKRGVFIEKRTLIPMTRVQHVDTEQGPLLRRYQLAVVSISTAATVHRIPGLSVKVADELRDQIAQLAAIADE